jgi:hypothetical protein
LRHQEDLLVLLHHRFQRADGLLASDEQRHDHVGKHHDIAQWEHGQQIAACGGRRCLVRASLRFRHRPFGFIHG